MFKKRFRIVCSGFEYYKYKIEQRRTILFFIHWWSTPEFEPPHLFKDASDAVNAITDHHKTNFVVDVNI